MTSDSTGDAVRAADLFTNRFFNLIDLKIRHASVSNGGKNEKLRLRSKAHALYSATAGRRWTDVSVSQGVSFKTHNSCDTPYDTTLLEDAITCCPHWTTVWDGTS